MAIHTEDKAARMERLVRPEHFTVRVEVSDRLSTELTYKEIVLLRANLRVVEKAARQMCAGMLKGVLKYEKGAGDRTAQDWLGWLKDDAGDVLNYVFLLGEALESE